GDKEVALPCRKEFSGVERDSCWSDIRCPEVDRLFHALLNGLVAVDGLSVVFVSVADHWKPVMLAFIHGIDFVTAARSMLAGPQFAWARIDGDTLHVSKAERVDFRVCVGPANKRVVLGN